MQFGFGAGVLYATRNDINNGNPVRFGALQDVSIEFDGEIKELYGQSQFALDVARAKTKITGKAKFAQISAGLMANTFFGVSVDTGMTASIYNEAATPALVTVAASADAASGTTLTFASVPATVLVGAPVANVTDGTTIPAGTYVVSKTSTTVVLSAAVTAGGVTTADSISFGAVVAADNAADFNTNLGVFVSSTGSPLALVTSNPSTTQYLVDTATGQYCFAAANASIEMLLNYTYDSTDGYTINAGNPLMGTTPKFRADLTQTYGSTQINVSLFSCVSNKLSLPTKLDDYVIQDFDFQAFANAAGQTIRIGMSSV